MLPKHASNRPRVDWRISRSPHFPRTQTILLCFAIPLLSSSHAEEHSAGTRQGCAGRVAPAWIPVRRLLASAFICYPATIMDDPKVPATKADMTRLDGLVSGLATTVKQSFEKIDARFTAIDKRFDAVDERFDAVDGRFDAVAKRFDAVDKRFDAVDERFERIEERIDGTDERIDNLSERMDQRFSEVFQKLADLSETRALIQRVENHEKRLTAAEKAVGIAA